MSKVTNLSRLAATISETAGGDLVVGTNPGGYDVILIVGQSNTQTGVGKDATLDAPSDLIKQLGHASPYKDVIIEAEDPLSGPNPPGSTYIGFAMTFAKQYIQGGNLRADRKVCIVHAGWGGTGFGNSNRWNPGQDLYRWAVRRANVVLNDYPGSRLVGILWHQGESDAGQTKEWYSTRLDWMIDRMRNDIVGDQSKTPFITGGMVPDWVAAASSTRDLIQQALKETKDRVPYTEYADPTAADASGIYLGDATTSTDGVNYMGDSIHYNAAGQRAMGKRYYAAWTRAINNTLQTTVPDPVTNVFANPGDEYVAVSWNDPSQTVTGYDLYYKLSSDAEWIHHSSINQANTPGYTLSGLTNGLEYDFKVVCFNDLGRSEDSVVVTAMPAEYELLSSDDDCVMFLDAEGGVIQDQTVAKLGKASGPTITNSSTYPVVAGNDAARGPVFLLDNENDNLSTNLTLNTSEYTKSAWVRWYDYPGSNYGNIISAASTADHAFGVESSSGVVRAGHGGSWSAISADDNAIPEYEWAHVALTYNVNDGPYDGSTTNARAFINGEQVSTATFSALSGNPNVFVFDFSTPGNGWRGAADNVRLHDKALGLCEIKELAGLGKLPAIQTGANLLYRYDATFGDNFNRLDRSYGCFNPFSETPHTERKYSILDRVERYRRSDGTFRFRIVFPNWKWQSTNTEELPQVIEFSQDDNPYDTTAGGAASNVVIHEALQGLSMTGFGGLRISALETDGSPHDNTVFDANTTTSPSNWYIPIGYLGGWDEAAMPVYASGTGTNATSTTVIELYAIMD